MAKKILIIDDSATAVSLIKGVLEKEGHEVITAKKGEEGIRSAGEKNPDLVFVDTLLPDIDGFEVCKRIKEARNAPKVILMTGSIDAIDAVRARKSGADEYAVKTSNFSKLLEAAKGLI